MHKTLFFQRDEHQTVGDGATYSEWWWTFPGANDPYAPDETPDPYAGYRYTGGGVIKKCFRMVKTKLDEWSEGKRKRNPVNILGADWTVDPNEALSGENGASYEGVTYTGRYAFLRDELCDNGQPRSVTQRRSWERQFAEVRNKLAGRTWKISSQEDPWFYRTGRVEIAKTDKNAAGEMTITADCDPWKYEMYSSMDTWLWDDLDFEYSIIREKEDYTVTVGPNETKTLPIFPLEKIEPIWVRSTDNASEGQNNRVAFYFEGDATAAWANLTTTWLKTTKSPSLGHVILYVRNETHLPEGQGYEAHPVTIEIMYRGAMR